MKRILLTLLTVVLVTMTPFAQTPDSCCVQLDKLIKYTKEVQVKTKVLLETDSLLRVESILFRDKIRNLDEKVRILDRKVDLKSEEVGIWKNEHDMLYLRLEEAEDKLEKQKKWYNSKFFWFGLGAATIITVTIFTK